MSGTTGTGKGLVLMSPTVEMLSDVSAPAANNGDVLTWQSATGQWVAAPAAGGGISAIAGDVSAAGTGTVSAVVVAIQKTQVSAGTITNNQVLTYLAAKSKWVPRAVAGSGTVTSVAVSGKTGIAVSGSPITGAGVITVTLGNITPTSISTGAGAFSSMVSANAGISSTTGNFSGLLTGATASFSGMVSANAGLRSTTGNFSGLVSADGGINTANVSASTASFSGVVSANAGIKGTTAGFSGLLTGATASFSGMVSANAGLASTTGSFSGLLTGSTASFSGIVSANAGLASTTGSFSGKITGTTAAFSGLVSADSGVSTTIVSCIRIIPTIVSVAYNGTTTVDASQASYFRGVAVSAFTLSANNAQDGQKIIYEIIQDGTGSRVMTLGALFALGTDITAATLTTTLNKRDFLGTFYNGTTNKHYITAFVKGY